MRLRINHRTRYAYGTPVSQSFNEIRLKPISSNGQACDSFALKVFPDAQLRHYLDFYFNFVHIFEVPAPHSELVVESSSDVTTSRGAQNDVPPVPLSKLSECAQLDSCYDFLQASPLISLSPEIWRLALDATQGVSDAWQAAQAIMRFVHDEFRYEPYSTHVHTHISEVLAERRGVCQDFAHVMLGMCRSLKLPARYVSGYLYNGPADQLTGAQASHAWCEVYLPGLGWRALDPTNNLPADERHVKIAVGRDYLDAAPIKGHYRGTKDNFMEVQVQVSRLED